MECAATRPRKGRMWTELALVLLAVLCCCCCLSDGARSDGDGLAPLLSLLLNMDTPSQGVVLPLPFHPQVTMRRRLDHDFVFCDLEVRGNGWLLYHDRVLQAGVPMQPWTVTVDPIHDPGWCNLRATLTCQYPPANQDTGPSSSSTAGATTATGPSGEGYEYAEMQYATAEAVIDVFLVHGAANQSATLSVSGTCEAARAAPPRPAHEHIPLIVCSLLPSSNEQEQEGMRLLADVDQAYQHWVHSAASSGERHADHGFHVFHRTPASDQSGDGRLRDDGPVRLGGTKLFAVSGDESLSALFAQQALLEDADRIVLLGLYWKRESTKPRGQDQFQNQEQTKDHRLGEPNLTVLRAFCNAPKVTCVHAQEANQLLLATMHALTTQAFVDDVVVDAHLLATAHSEGFMSTMMQLFFEHTRRQLSFFGALGYRGQEEVDVALQSALRYVDTVLHNVASQLTQTGRAAVEAVTLLSSRENVSWQVFEEMLPSSPVVVVAGLRYPGASLEVVQALKGLTLEHDSEHAWDGLDTRSAMLRKPLRIPWCWSAVGTIGALSPALTKELAGDHDTVASEPNSGWRACGQTLLRPTGGHARHLQLALNLVHHNGSEAARRSGYSASRGPQLPPFSTPSPSHTLSQAGTQAGTSCFAVTSGRLVELLPDHFQVPNFHERPLWPHTLCTDDGDRDGGDGAPGRQEHVHRNYSMFNSRFDVFSRLGVSGVLMQDVCLSDQMVFSVFRHQGEGDQIDTEPLWARALMQGPQHGFANTMNVLDVRLKPLNLGEEGAESATAPSCNGSALMCLLSNESVSLLSPRTSDGVTVVATPVYARNSVHFLESLTSFVHMLLHRTVYPWACQAERVLFPRQVADEQETARGLLRLLRQLFRLVCDPAWSDDGNGETSNTAQGVDLAFFFYDHVWDLANDGLLPKRQICFGKAVWIGRAFPMVLPSHTDASVLRAVAWWIAQVRGPSLEGGSALPAPTTTDIDAQIACVRGRNGSLFRSDNRLPPQHTQLRVAIVDRLSSRRWANLESLAAALRFPGHGVHAPTVLGGAPILLELLTFEQAVQLFAWSDVIVAVHGAGLLAHLPFASPGTTVVECFPSNFWYPSHNLAGMGGLRHRPMWSVGWDDAPHSRWRGTFVDPDSCSTRAAFSMSSGTEDGNMEDQGDGEHMKRLCNPRTVTLASTPSTKELSTYCETRLRSCDCALQPVHVSAALAQAASDKQMDVLACARFDPRPTASAYRDDLFVENRVFRFHDMFLEGTR